MACDLILLGSHFDLLIDFLSFFLPPNFHYTIFPVLEFSTPTAAHLALSFQDLRFRPPKTESSLSVGPMVPLDEDLGQGVRWER